MHSHQSLLHSELMLEGSTFMEIQFEQRKLDAGMYQDVAGQIQQQLADLRRDISSQEAVIISAFNDFLRRLEGPVKDQRTEAISSTQETKSLESRVTQLKKWIDGPDYMYVLERARSYRAEDTCSWFVNTPEYRAWKSRKRQSRAQRDDWQTLQPSRPQDDILFTTAKPGFGKTTLSSFIIEDLSQPASESDEASPSGVLFYHFASDMGNACDPIHAFRAMLAQLVHLCRKKKDVIDSLSVLYEGNAIGHVTASENQVMECLALILSLFNDVVLLADGIDECTDGPRFLSLLKTLHAETNVKTLLFCRPSVDISDPFPSCSSFDLDITKNRDDISRYLTPRVERLRKKKLLPMEYGVQQIVEKLTNKSTGMFLWASLMIKYLNCNALSLNDRREAIFYSNTVEGIEGIYSAILRTLERSYARQREKVERIFWLIAVALRPLSVLELQFAISIKPGTATHKDDLIPNLETALPSMCGALVEVLPNEKVAFLHLSFRDFITTPSAQMERSPFFVDLQRRHLDAASVFLSYQIYDVPRSPIQPGRETRDPEICSIVSVMFPLLQYALAWSQHLVKFTEQSPPEGLEITPACLRKPCSTLLALLVELTKTPLCVTAWIESSWMFHSIPTLDGLVGILSAETFPFHQFLRQFPQLLADMQTFASDLVQLNNQWGHLLSRNPSAIWTSSITAFIQSDFWYHNGDFQVSVLASKQRARQEQPSAILIQSQVSSSGDILGIVQVTPSRQYVNMAQNIFDNGRSGGVSHPLVMSQKQALIKLVTGGWKVKYEQKSILSEKTIMAIEHELHPDEIRELLEQSLASNKADRFPFPVAMSSDLRRVAILRTLCTVCENAESPGSGYSFRTQHLGSSTPASASATEMTMATTGTVSYSPLFSPDGNALVFVMKDLATVEQSVQRRRLELWVQEGKDSDFLRRGVVTASWFDLSTQNDDVGIRGLVFHPYLPLIVYPTWLALTAWWFGGRKEDLKSPVVVSRVSGIPQRFSDNTMLEYLSWSVANSDGTMDSNDETPSARPEMGSPHTTHHTVDISWFLDSNQQSAGTDQESLTRAVPSVLTEHRGWDTTSPHLTRDHAANAVLWHPNAASDKDITTNSRILLHLPRLVPGEQTFVSLLGFSKNDEWVRMVWNQGQQNSYSVRDEVNPYLPAIISRKRAALDQQGQTLKRQVLSLH